MKKYFRSSAKVFGILSLICLLMIILGVILVITSTDFFELKLLLFGFGIPLGTIFFTCYIAENKYLIIDQEKIVFPFELTCFYKNNSSTKRFRKTPVFFKDIKYVKIRFEKGDKIITKDTYFYDFHLNDGTEFSKCFYHYGKYEKEIVSNLSKKIKFDT